MYDIPGIDSILLLMKITPEIFNSQHFYITFNTLVDHELHYLLVHFYSQAVCWLGLTALSAYEYMKHCIWSVGNKMKKYTFSSAWSL